MSILIIDDDTDLLKTMKACIEEAGNYCVSAVPDAAIGLDLLKRTAYRLIIVDIAMPGMDGFEFVHLAKKHYPQSRVMVMSGRANLAVVSRMRGLGADAFFPKPIDMKILLEFVEELHAGIRTGDE